MPTEVTMGQNWSIWVPGRQQWLLATVTARENGQATLAFDERYGLGKGQDRQVADETAMLSVSNLFRLVKAAV